MDGRTQKPVIEYMEKNFGAKYVDMITEAGPNKIIVDGKEADIINAIKERVRISTEMHGSKILAIAGHYDCARNPAGEMLQKEQLNKAMKIIRSWGFGLDKIMALWLDEHFTVKEIICP